jgi:DNA-binding transcriptional ArsR family regulator
MHAFDILGDPVRRRILEMLAEGEHTAGEITSVIQNQFGISQPAVSQHLRVLRDGGFAYVRADGTRRLYTVSSRPLQEVDTWLRRFRHLWDQPLDALETELARGMRERGARAGNTQGSTVDEGPPVRKEEP